MLYCGAFAFLGGVVRFLSIDTTAMTFVNYGSALAGLFAPIALMLLWRFRTVRYTIDGVFRLAFPLIVVALGALPFAYGTPLVVAAALLYMIYSFLSLSVHILAVQVSHDYGIDPVFCLSFQTLVCVAAQGLGYLLGALAPCGTAFDVSPYAVIALGSVCFLALVLYGTPGASSLALGDEPAHRVPVAGSDAGGRDRSGVGWRHRLGCGRRDRGRGPGRCRAAALRG